MSAQSLSAKSTRRLALELDEPTITRAWVNNSEDHHVVHFATWDHEHGAVDRRTGECRILPGLGSGMHTAECYGEDGRLLLDLDPFDDDGRWPTLRD